MRLAIEEAKLALKADEVPIGAIIVSGGCIVGRGHNLVETLVDVTAHAEIQAITAASSTIGGKYLNDCTLYVTESLGVGSAEIVIVFSVSSYCKSSLLLTLADLMRNHEMKKMVEIKMAISDIELRNLPLETMRSNTILKFFL